MSLRSQYMGTLYAKAKRAVALGAFLIIFFIFHCCNNPDVTQSQRKTLDLLYDDIQKLTIEYYSDSTIYKAYESNKHGDEYGRVVEFYPNGNLLSIYFINKSGEMVGDGSLFDKEGDLFTYDFRLDSSSILLYLSFKKGKLIDSQGKPWFIQGPSECKLGDTASYFIACPIVPGYTTKVQIGVINDSTPVINYVNDLRQMNYKFLANTTGTHKFKLKVTIRNKKHVIVNDSTTFLLNVKDQS